MSKEVFSKVIPNIKLGTRFDGDGNEIDVEIRLDSEAQQCQKKIFDLLLSAGYFRVMIKNLSDFDKIVGGMTWCIEATGIDVDVDLLFHENLTIGQKIALVEQVVTVLPRMKCPFALEPHQIQGLDFISIYPVVQWLVKESVNLRNEKAERLKLFAVGQFHNHFSMSSSTKNRVDRNKVLKEVKKIEDLYAIKRQFKRKHNVEPDDEKSRVRLTLLEYGIKNISRSLTKASDSKAQSFDKESLSEEVEQDEFDVEQLLSENLSIAKEEIYQNTNLTEEERQEIAKHYENLKIEMTIDAKELSENNKIKQFEAMESALEKRLRRIIEENEALSTEVEKVGDDYEALKKENESIVEEMQRLEVQEQETDITIKDEIKSLILQNEKLKQEEIDFKKTCTKIVEELYTKIKEAEIVAAMPDDDQNDLSEVCEKENETLRLSRLQLAKKNRSVISLQRQLDNIPDNIELAQYQKRFLELYNNMSLKHKETKQFYALYNTLNDTHLYLDKELTLLNSIYDNYNQAMTTIHSKEQFLAKFGEIVEGVATSKTKIKRKNDEEKSIRDQLNTELLNFIELQRRYAGMIKQFRIACEKQ